MPDPIPPRPYHHGSLRSALLDAAERRLSEHGADGLSLRDLARALEVSHAAPRRHFADRQALLDALAERGFARLGETLHAASAPRDRDFARHLREAASAFAHFATEHASLFDLMHASKRRPDAAGVAAASAAAFAPMLALIEEGQSQGALQAGDAERLGLILFSTMLGITTMVNAGLVDAALLDELVEQSVSQFVRGATP